MSPLQLGAAILAFAFLVTVHWCQERFGTYDPLTNDRTCGTPPRVVAQWSFTHHARRPEERRDLEAWVSRNGESVNARYMAQCQTPLHLAARFGREDLAAVLIDGGADVDAPDEPGDRPLHLAADYGEAAVARVLLARGASVEAPGANGRTPLHAAAAGLAGTSDEGGRLQVTRLLLARGADVNARERGNRFTPLWYAARNGSGEVADLLRASGGIDPGDARR